MTTVNLILAIASIALFPAIIWMLIVGFKVKRIFKKYDKIGSTSMITGNQMARGVLNRAGLNDVDVAMISGRLTDHFDPKDNTVYLSEATFNSASVAALGIAAHEVGHAIQHNEQYAPLKLRTSLVPYINITSRFAFPLIFIGIILEALFQLTNFSYILLYIGISFYGTYTLFTLITLPVEYNASSRAKKILYESGILSVSETKMAGEVLSAAAKTYLAAFVVSLLQFLRLLSLLMGRRR